MNCGGVVETFVTNIQAHPFLAIVLLILIIAIVMLISNSDKKSVKNVKTLPPPEIVIPDNI